MSKPLIIKLKEELEKVVERGSNEKGTYIKFADGTLIQYGSTSGVDKNYKLVNFPISFTNINVVSGSVSVADYNFIHLVQTFDYTINNFKAYVRFQSISGGAWETGSNWFTWLAVGTWK